MNMLLVKKYYLPFKIEQQNKLGLLILLYKKLYKNNSRPRNKQNTNKIRKSIEKKCLEELENNDIKNKLSKIKKKKKEIKGTDLKYETSKYICDFQKFQTIRNFGDNIYNDEIILSEADEG